LLFHAFFGGEKMRLKKYAILAAALVAVTAMVSMSFGELLGIADLLNFPGLVYDAPSNPDATTYNATSDLLSIDATPIAIRFAPTEPPRFVNPTGDPPAEVLTIRAVIDASGTLIGGIENEDLVVTGEVDADGDGDVDYAGVLLTGEVAEFGFLDGEAPSTTDQFDFRFNVTGGLLADDFFLDQDIGITLTSESSDFAGSFTVSFDGGAKGTLGPIALPVELGGCTPGYWKQPHNFDSWPAPYGPDDLFEDVFGAVAVNIIGAESNPILSEALRLKRGGINALIRHATAALLNAAHPDVNPEPAFDTPDKVIAAFQAAVVSGDIETTKALLEDSNEAGCPLN
jgi:hypothetical protein